MTTNKRLDSNSAMDKPFFRVLTGLGLLGILFYIATINFSGLIDDVVDQKYDMIAERFEISMNHIRKEWYVQGKPKRLKLNYYLDSSDYETIHVNVTKQGWPLNVGGDADTLDCLNLWMYFAHDEKQKKGIMALTQHLQVKEMTGNCHFIHQQKRPNPVMFSYNLKKWSGDLQG